MQLKNTLKLTALMTGLLFAGCSSSTPYNHSRTVSGLDANAKYTGPRSINNFNDYVQFLKQKAAGQGVSSATLNAQNNIYYIQKAVDLDRKQAGRSALNRPPVINPNGITNYLNRVLTAAKVDAAEENYRDVQKQLNKASKTYAVQKEYLLALWGMESSFGDYQGNYDVLSVLATLAFDGRREALFSGEFINAMKMLDRDHIKRGKMQGSWAGAMGQTQFMPSSYLRYAADGNGDGENDIWTNHYDVFASIAKYLSTVSWDEDLPWGVEVNISQYIPLNTVGTEQGKQKSLRRWQSMGVSLKNPTVQEQKKLNELSSADLWLVRPDKEAGRAFLVSNNFRTLLDWNRSNYFAVSVGMFADRIRQRIGQ